MKKTKAVIILIFNRMAAIVSKSNKRSEFICYYDEATYLVKKKKTKHNVVVDVELRKYIITCITCTRCA